MHFTKTIVLILCHFAVLQWANIQAADPKPAIPPKIDKSVGTLHLIGGDVYRGEIASGSNQEANGALIWRCPAFASDLIVPWNAIDRLTQPSLDAPQPEPQSTDSSAEMFVFELQSGETISGRFANMMDQWIEVDSPLAGKHKLPIESIRSILRIRPTMVAQGGSLAISDWKQVAPPIKAGGRSKWFERTGSYDTETAGTAITQQVVVPDLVAIDIEVAWEQASPNWMLTLGEPRRMELHFRKLETRNMISITILVDDELSADIETAQIPSDGLSSISLRMLCDSNRGRFVLLQNGIPIAQLRLTKSMRLTGRHSLTFTNIAQGQISLRELRVYPSVFTAPFMKPKGTPEANPDEARVTETLLRNGETFVGRPSQFDAATRSFGFADGNTNLGRVSIEQVERIEFPPSETTTTSNESKPFFVAELKSGARYFGQAAKMQGDNILLTIDSIKSTVQMPVQDLQSMGLSVSASNPKTTRKIDLAGMMKFVSPWTTSTGTIDRVAANAAEGNGADNRPKLFWKPIATNSVALARDATGTIEPILIGPAKSVNDLTVARNVNPKTGQKPTETDYGRPLKADEPSLFLKSGDCFPAVVDIIDETQTNFKSEIFEAGQIENEYVRGIRVLAYTGADINEKGVRKRLLTLPRSQRSNPPSHLIVSREGDAIRGHLKGLTPDIATMEVRGSECAIMMKTVAEIIWLLDAPEIVPLGKELEKKSTPEIEPKSNGSDSNRELECQALFSSGTRISVVPDRIENGILYGQHPQLGNCQIDLSKIARLVLGDAIMEEAERNRFGKWRLENAIDPKFVNDLDSPEEGGAANNPNSVFAKMIGEAAPEFELKKMDGTLLRLSDLRGKIVVLDFWATWCGPCIASLPKLTEISQEYKGAGVELITINIEQKPAEIQAMLSRLEINPTVVLDSDGAIARAYRAQAIPQTVVIDRMGNVSQVIVGAGDSSEKKVRETLDMMLNTKL